MSLTQARLKQLFDYNPLTGLFVRRVTVRSGDRAGDIAGSLTTAGYVTIQVDGKQYQAHRLAFLYMTGDFPADEVDHIDTVRDNNRWANLRPANRTQNSANMRIHPSNTTGFKGVSLHNGGPKFRADVKVNGKKKYLGCYSTPEEAHVAYCAAANDRFGEFARVA